MQDFDRKLNVFAKKYFWMNILGKHRMIRASIYGGSMLSSSGYDLNQHKLHIACTTSNARQSHGMAAIYAHTYMFNLLESQAFLITNTRPTHACTRCAHKLRNSYWFTITLLVYINLSQRVMKMTATAITIAFASI